MPCDNIARKCVRNVIANVRIGSHLRELACQGLGEPYSKPDKSVAYNPGAKGVKANFVNKSIGDMARRCQRLHAAEGKNFEEGGVEGLREHGSRRERLQQLAQ